VLMHRGEDLVVERESGEQELAAASEQLAQFFGVKGGHHEDS
jgi:hypothetical protein